MMTNLPIRTRERLIPDVGPILLRPDPGGRERRGLLLDVNVCPFPGCPERHVLVDGFLIQNLDPSNLSSAPGGPCGHEWNQGEADWAFAASVDVDAGEVHVEACDDPAALRWFMEALDGELRAALLGRFEAQRAAFDAAVAEAGPERPERLRSTAGGVGGLERETADPRPGGCGDRGARAKHACSRAAGAGPDGTGATDRQERPLPVRLGEEVQAVLSGLGVISPARRPGGSSAGSPRIFSMASRSTGCAIPATTSSAATPASTIPRTRDQRTRRCASIGLQLSARCAAPAAAITMPSTSCTGCMRSCSSRLSRTSMRSPERLTATNDTARATDEMRRSARAGEVMLPPWR